MELLIILAVIAVFALLALGLYKLTKFNTDAKKTAKKPKKLVNTLTEAELAAIMKDAECTGAVRLLNLNISGEEEE